MLKTYKAEVVIDIATESDAAGCPLYPYSHENLVAHLSRLIAIEFDRVNAGELPSRDNTSSEVVSVKIDWDTLRAVGIAPSFSFTQKEK